MIQHETIFNKLLTSQSDGVVFSNSQNKIIFCNQGTCKIFSYSSQDIIGKINTSLIAPSARKNFQTSIKNIKAGNLLNKKIETIGLSKSGTEIQMELFVSQWKSEKDIFYTWIIRLIVNSTPDLDWEAKINEFNLLINKAIIDLKNLPGFDQQVPSEKTRTEEEIISTYFYTISNSTRLITELIHYLGIEEQPPVK